MDFLRAVHAFALPVPGIGHHLVFLATLLFVVSLFMALRPGVPALFVWLLRLNWLAYGINALTGLILALSGQKVPSATVKEMVNGRAVSPIGFLVDPHRQFDHYMYAAFALVTLYALEVLIAGKLVKDTPLRRLLFVTATFFLVGVAYMGVRTAYLPGTNPTG